MYHFRTNLVELYCISEGEREKERKKERAERVNRHVRGGGLGPLTVFWVDVGVGYCANPADMSQYIINRQYATKTVSECRAVCAATSGCISIAISSASSNSCWIYGVVPAISGFGQNSNGSPIPTALSVVGNGDVGVQCFALRPGASSCVFVSGLCDSMFTRS